ncbi:MAG: hypothetical protein JRM91_04785 [Nitrososphaerota archaeon]|jgi:hypothetical protein|nr:hypothetical protein [Nitrososphaerota archaeon]
MRPKALGLREIDIRLDEPELVDSIIERLDGEISSIVPTDPNAKLLDALPGVAPYTALFLSSAIGGLPLPRLETPLRVPGSLSRR